MSGNTLVYTTESSDIEEVTFTSIKFPIEPLTFLGIHTPPFPFRIRANFFKKENLTKEKKYPEKILLNSIHDTDSLGDFIRKCKTAISDSYTFRRFPRSLELWMPYKDELLDISNDEKNYLLLTVKKMKGARGIAILDIPNDSDVLEDEVMRYASSIVGLYR